VYLILAVSSNNVGRYEEGLAATRTAEAHALACTEVALRTLSIRYRARSLLGLGRLDEAIATLRDVYRLARAAGDLDSENVAQCNLGYAFFLIGDFARSEEYSLAALESAEQLRDTARITLLAFNVGELKFLVGDWHRAREYYQRAATAVGQLDVSITSACPPLGRGMLLLAQGQPEAITLLEQAADLAERTTDRPSYLKAHRLLAEKEMIDGRAQEAYTRLAPLLDGPGQDDPEITCLLPYLAWAALLVGDDVHADGWVRDALSRAALERNLPARADALLVRALLAIARQEWDAGRGALEVALALTHEMPYLYAAAKAHYVYGQLYAAKGEPEQARAQYEQAIAICEGLGEGLYRPHIERALADLTGE
jgi:tetratricopeptide (TPR) repeat protein